MHVDRICISFFNMQNSIKGFNNDRFNPRAPKKFREFALWTSAFSFQRLPPK